MAAGFVHLLETPPPQSSLNDTPSHQSSEKSHQAGGIPISFPQNPRTRYLIRWVGLSRSKQAKNFSHIVLQFILPNLHLFLPGPHSILPDLQLFLPGPHSILPDLQLFLLDLHILQPNFKLIEI